MKRLFVMKEEKGVRVSHGTMLILDDDKTAITSHPLDGKMPTAYYVSEEAVLSGGFRVLSAPEMFLPLSGIATQSIAPYVYRDLTFEKPSA